MSTPQERRAAQRRTAKALKAGQNPLGGEFGAIVSNATSRLNESALSHAISGLSPAEKALRIGKQARGMMAGNAKESVAPEAPMTNPDFPHMEPIGDSASMSYDRGWTKSPRQYINATDRPDFGRGVNPSTNNGVPAPPTPAKPFGIQYGNVPPGPDPRQPSLDNPQPIVNGGNPNYDESLKFPVFGREVPTSKNNGIPASVLGSKQLGGKKTENMNIGEAMMRGIQRHSRYHGQGGIKLSEHLAKITASPLPDMGRISA